MTTYEPATSPRDALADKLHRLESPVARRSIERLRQQYAKDGDVPSLEEIRDILDQALGSRPIKELLDEVRGKS